jgi:hypothetical protein
MAGDEVVDFKPVLNRTDAVFEAFVDSHALLPKRRANSEWRIANRTNC